MSDLCVAENETNIAGVLSPLRMFCDLYSIVQEQYIFASTIQTNVLDCRHVEKKYICEKIYN